MATHLAIHPLQRLIAEGEGPSLDFKKTISSATKIAKTLVAFANTHGGSLLVGVRDNGTVAGVSSEEEMYMIDTAAKVMCQPAVRYQFKQHDYRGMVVLEVIVPESYHKPHQAKQEDGAWRPFLRVNDKSVVASAILLAVMRRQAEGLGARIQYGPEEQALLSYLNLHPQITLDEAMEIMITTRRKASTVLVNLLVAGMLRPVFAGDRDEAYTLA
jgi:hypothetical protein